MIVSPWAMTYSHLLKADIQSIVLRASDLGLGDVHWLIYRMRWNRKADSG